MRYLAANLPTGSIIAGSRWTAIRIANPDDPNLPWHVAPGITRYVADAAMQANLDRGLATVLRVGEKTPGPLAELHTELTSLLADGASSNDIVGALDSFLVDQGFPTVLYA
jgi:hypothetical protein